jgi:hypothetical protein
VFEAAERLAKRLGRSRSELYTAAICEYLGGHRDDGMTERLDQIYATAPDESEVDGPLMDLQIRSLAKNDW